MLSLRAVEEKIEFEHWRIVAGQASAAPQHGSEGRRGQRSPLQAHSGTGIVLARACSCWFAWSNGSRKCAMLGRVLAENRRNFTTAGWSTMVISGAMPCNSGLIHTLALGP